METVLKQRLIGTVVIIALAVIFVPMILDDSGPQESVVLNVEVPPEPKFNFESELPDPKQLDEVPVLATGKEPDSKPLSVEKDVKSEVQQPDADKVSSAKIVEATANHIKPNPALNTWVVQVAAFGEKHKAIALQEKLLVSSYSVFIEKSVNGNEVLYRVKIGPELKREDAEKLRDKVKKEQSLMDSFVTNHP